MMNTWLQPKDQKSMVLIVGRKYIKYTFLPTENIGKDI